MIKRYRKKPVVEEEKDVVEVKTSEYKVILGRSQSLRDIGYICRVTPRDKMHITTHKDFGGKVLEPPITVEEEPFVRYVDYYATCDHAGRVKRDENGEVILTPRWSSEFNPGFDGTMLCNLTPFAFQQFVVTSGFLALRDMAQEDLRAMDRIEATKPPTTVEGA